MVGVGQFGRFGGLSVQRLALWWVWDISGWVGGLSVQRVGLWWVWDILGGLGV